ncbi:hypothetical protein [uncultured Desulfobacter sp.]|uniref:hypothetical protein n=1 Tax=uncultured Desulfobacter sp. TaxID=240139 RepID=UPI0029C6A39A|nr:hypothetical protein [uncultured Desulfobacter sp.]
MTEQNHPAGVSNRTREATMKFTLKAVTVAIAMAIVIVLYGGLYTLEEGLQAIVVQFGRPVGEPVT